MAYLDPTLSPRINDIPLPSRLVGEILDEPAIYFTPVEDDMAAKNFEFMLVMKFSLGGPSLFDVKMHISKTWKLLGSFQVGLLYPCHIMVHLQSEEDLIRMLLRESHVINTTYYRLFRWTKDFVFKKDSTNITV